MTDFRTDWLTGRSVLLAENRALRPNEFAEQSADAEGAAHGDAPHAPCPFCPGQEAGTPPAVLTKADEAGQWRVRVVPNKFPAVAVDDLAGNVGGGGRA